MADSNQDFSEDVNTVPTEDGTTWVEITSAATEDEANLIKGFLENEGVPVQIETLKFTMEPVNFGMMGEIRVYVGAEDEVRAQELLRGREQEYERLDDDEETLVTDEGPANIGDGTDVENNDGATES